MYEFISYMGNSIERKRLFPVQYILSLLEDGGPRFTTLEAICKALDCQPGDILEYVPEE